MKKKMDYLFCGFEVKDFGIEKKQFGNDELEVFKFSGYASTFDIDLTNDKIMPGAFSDAKPVTLLWGHDQWSPAIGKLTSVNEDEIGLFVHAEMPMDDRRVREEIVPQMKIGSVNAMSIGFFPHNVRIDGNLRKIGRVELIETSLVNFPANPEARVTALKNWLGTIDIKAVTPWDILPKSLTARDRMWDSGEAVSRWRNASGSEEEPSAMYKENFLWYDAAAPDSFGSYKLPIGDVINGNQVAVPRAIFAARAALAGARGGVDIPDADRPDVERNINRYYELMGLDEPFTNERSMIGIAEIKNLPHAELMHVLKSQNLSHRACKYLAGLVCAEQESHVDLDDRQDMKALNETLNQAIQKLGA